MNGTAKKFLSVVAFVAAFMAVRYAMNSYREHEAVGRVEKSMEQMKNDGVQKHPDAPVSEAMRQEAVEKSAAKLNAETDPNKRLATAASNFLGFFFVNTREWAAFCREQGVDILPFVSAFQRGHTTELAKARAALSNSPVNEDKLYVMLKAQLRQVIIQDMNDMASSNKISVKEACEFISTNGEALALEMHISKMQPAVYQALSVGR